MAIITKIKEKILTLNEASFQILCDSYLSKEGYPNIVSLGTKSGAEKTTPGTPDTYFFTEDKKYIFVEYTTQQSSLTSKIENDLDKCLDEKKTGILIEEISEIIFCHTSSNISPEDDKKFRKKCEDLEIKLTIIGIDVLSERLLSKYPKLVKDHLGLTIDTEQVQKVEDFITQYNANGISAPLDNPFLFREKEFEEIDSIFDTKSVVVLSGAAGVGKTKMALEYAKKHSFQFGEIMYCIHDRSLPMYEDLCTYLEKPGSYFLVIDDANQILNLDIIIDYVNKQNLGYFVKIIITVRDYAIDKVRYNLGKKTTYEIINVKHFSDNEIKELVRTSLGIINEKYLDRIVRIAEGNSRMAILAGKIACQTNSLDSINDASELYNEYYGRVLHDSTLQFNQKLLISAGIIAFLNSFHLDQLDALNELLISNGITLETFKEDVYTLHELEIVDIYHDKAVKISEQCFSNFILKYVFYDKKLLSLSQTIEFCFISYKKRVVYSVNTIVSVFRDENINSFVTNEIKLAWNKFLYEKTSYFMEFLKIFHAIDPAETFIILNNFIEQVDKKEILAESIDIEKGKNYQSIDDDIINIIGQYADSEELDCALDLFFKYYLKCPNKYIQFYHAINVFYNVNVDSWKYGYFTQIKLIEKFVQYSDNWKNQYIRLLFCDVVPNLISLNFSPSKMSERGNTVTIYNFVLKMDNGVDKYRKLIWEQLLIICSNEIDKVKSILYGYGKTFDETCYDVMKMDFIFIEKIINAVFSTNQLSDDIIVQHIGNIFENISINSDIFELFESSFKMKIYNLLTGPRRCIDLEYVERKKLKESQLKDYVDQFKDKFSCFRTLFNICREATEFKHANHYEVYNGLNIAMLHICEVKDLFIEIFTYAIKHNFIKYLLPYDIIESLINLISPNELLEMIHKIKSKVCKNIWEFNFYNIIPEKFITQSIVENLYGFLLSHDDENITNIPSRDIRVFKKYEKIDTDVILKSAKIIFKKKEYSSYMVKIYFGELFNSYLSSPEEVISLFTGDCNFLEELYLWFEENDIEHDDEGKFLHALHKNNNNFLTKYIHKVYKICPYYQLADRFEKCKIFLANDDYQEVLNIIVNVLFDISQNPILDVSHVLECFVKINKCDEIRINNFKTWILMYIENNALDNERMQCVFGACSNADIEMRTEIVSCFLKVNGDFEFFKTLTLTAFPRSGWTGSVVNIYSSWIEFYKKILPMLTGLSFIKHKKLIQDRINSIEKSIINAEVSEILENSYDR